MLMSGCVTYNEVETPPTPVDYRGNPPTLVFEVDEQVFGLDPTPRFELLQSGDVLKLTISGDGILTGNYTIPPDGVLRLPLVENLPTRGKTVQALEGEVAKAASLLYENPTLRLSVDVYSPRYAYLFGAFREPGAIALNAGDSLLTVMARAGGLEARENALKQPLGMPRMARVIRRNKHVATVNLPGLVSGRDLASNIALEPGDLVYVERDDAPTITILGEVLRPGLQGLTPGMDLIQALAQAGGLTGDADEDEVRVLRRWWSDSPQTFLVDLDYLQRGAGTPALILEDRDLIYVRPTNLATVNAYIRQITSPFTTVGATAGSLPVSPAGP